MECLRRTLLAMILTAFVAGGVDAQATDSTGIRMAGLTWLLDSVLPKHQANITAVCVGFTNAAATGTRPVASDAVDLNAAEFPALPKGSLPVHPGSACTVEQAAPKWTVVTATGKRAVSVLVGPVRSLSAGQWSVGVQLRINGRYGEGYLCEAVRAQDQWHMTGCRATWIS